MHIVCVIRTQYPFHNNWLNDIEYIILSIYDYKFLV